MVVVVIDLKFNSSLAPEATFTGVVVHWIEVFQRFFELSELGFRSVNLKLFNRHRSCLNAGIQVVANES